MFQTYFKSIQTLYLSDRESSEMTFRTPLENLLKEFESDIIKRDLIIKHEPSKQNNKVRPDFKVTTKEQLTIGFIETKKIGEDLKKILLSKQLDNYKKLSDNIIVTNYLHFYLIKKGEPVLDVALFSDYNLKNKRYKIEQSRIDELSKLLRVFFESEPETIYKTKDLALKLSEKAIFLKNYCIEELNAEHDETGKLQGLYEVFKESLLPLLEKDFFADIYSQTITYGLFLAALNCNDPKQELNKNSAFSLLPSSFPLIRELFHNIDDFPIEIVWAIDEIISILKVTDFIAIKREFAEYRQKGKGFDDPFIFFYEDFLKYYDKQQRELRGVYYTPEPVVSFITRSVELILKNDFNLKDGFINKDVTLLDFATGTGTFLLHSFKLAIEEAQKIVDKMTVNKILNENIINRFYGFELLVAPYVIAHLKISEFFKEQGYYIEYGKRLNIFLTNTLTNYDPQPFPIMPNLSKEGQEANRIKNKDLLIILGNPPYSVSSSNKTGFIAEDKMNRYKQVVKSEKNIQPLSDDYIKFIRFAHWKMESVERGVIGIITNNSFLDGLIHRGMREELMKDFDEIYILNLHGNSRIGEKCPDGTNDENVFDIMQGVSISFFVKKDNKTGKHARIFYQDLYGLRENKYSYLFDNNIKSIDWTELKPESKYNFFIFKDFSANGKYLNCLKIDEIFKKFSSGIKTHRDKLIVAIKKTDLEFRIKHFYSLSKNEIINEFDIKDTRDWKIEKALKKGKYQESFLQKIDYRPFDTRFIYYDLDFIDSGTNRYEVMQHFIIKPNENYKDYKNLALSFSRGIKVNNFNTVFITKNIADIHLTGGLSYIAPIYIYKINDDINYSSGNEFLFKGEDKKDNFSNNFRKYFKSIYKQKYTPENILGYIYAILHSPTYRTKYIEFLKIDFPRIPFTAYENLFKKLSDIGFELIEHHLLKKEYRPSISKFYGETDNYKVEKVEYDEKEMKVSINKDRYFQPVPVDIWNFYIGGYQVLDKWLKERKKHEISLSGEDIHHFIKVVNVIDHTIKTMQKIDELTKDWI